MRLTKKDKYGHFYTNDANCRNVYSKDGNKLEGVYFANQTLAIDGDAIDKLGKLENIEEKLGFDLIKFLKATINGIYIKEFKKLYLDYNFAPTIYRFNNKGKYFERECEDMGARWIEKYYLKDYGKTWVLTKEELENASDND